MNEGKQRDLENEGKLKIVIPDTWTPCLPVRLARRGSRQGAFPAGATSNPAAFLVETTKKPVIPNTWILPKGQLCDGNSCREDSIVVIHDVWIPAIHAGMTTQAVIPNVLVGLPAEPRCRQGIHFRENIIPDFRVPRREDNLTGHF